MEAINVKVVKERKIRRIWTRMIKFMWQGIVVW